MVVGTIKWFNNVKGFGFLTTEEHKGKDIFIHFGSIQMEGYRTLNANQSVMVQVVEGPSGLKAEKVELI